MDKWKITAIIFILISIIELSYIAYIGNVALHTIEYENKCIDICVDEGTEFYEYDYYEDICYCFNDLGGEILYKEYLV